MGHFSTGFLDSAHDAIPDLILQVWEETTGEESLCHRVKILAYFHTILPKHIYRRPFKWIFEGHGFKAACIARELDIDSGISHGHNIIKDSNRVWNPAHRIECV